MSQSKLWGGRFTKPTAKAVERFTHSLEIDRRIGREDITGSIAHARMLGKQKIIPSADAKKLVASLQKLLKDWDAGKVRLDPSAEDIHTVIQKEIEKRAGKSAGRLHTARSRNDQVVTAFKLHCNERLALIELQLKSLQQAILNQAQKNQTLLMPGYTHWRHAQPVMVAHLLLSYVTMLQRDRERISDAVKRMMAQLPLGACALTGTGLKTNRAAVAKELGFSGVSMNSIDAVSDRDFAAEILSALSITGIHGSRIAEELILWSTEEFGFLHFEESLLTGSSMMPQKQNPDFLELVRGSSACIIGRLTGLLTLLKGLSSGYNRDLQLDKEIVLDAFDKIDGILSVLILGFNGIRFNRVRMERQLADESLYATDLAEYLVQKGLPFSEAHRAVGQLLAHADKNNQSLKTLPLSVYRKFSSRFGPDAARLINPAVSVSRKQSAGSTNPGQVRQQIAAWKKALR